MDNSDIISISGGDNHLIRYRRAMDIAKLGFILIIYHYLLKILAYGFYYGAYFVLSRKFTLSWGELLKFFGEKSDILNSTAFSMAANISITLSALIITALISGLFLRITVWKFLRPTKQDFKTGIEWIPPCFVLNMIFSLIVAYATSFLSVVGVSVPTSDFSISDPSVAAVVLQYLYIIVLAPIIEETIYRGFIIKVISPYNKVAAVLVSAAAFGLMHGNFPQAISAFATGIVYGIIAVKSQSIIPTIIIHSANNLLANFGILAGAIGFTNYSTLYSIIQIAVALLGFFFLFTRFDFIKLKNNKNSLKYSPQSKIWLNPLILLYFIILVYELISSFIKAN